MQDFDGRKIRIAKNLRYREKHSGEMRDPQLPTHASA